MSAGPSWVRNETDAALRRAAVYIYVDDGVTYAPAATSFVTGIGGNVQIRRGGFSWVVATGTLTNTGIDGHWVYEATQTETDYDGVEFEIKVEKNGFTRAMTLVYIEQPVNLATVITDNIMSYVLRTGRTVRGHLRRMDALFYGKVLGMLGPTVTAYQPGGTTVEFDVNQNLPAGTRDEANTTTSEIP